MDRQVHNTEGRGRGGGRGSFGHGMRHNQNQRQNQGHSYRQQGQHQILHQSRNQNQHYYKEHGQNQILNQGQHFNQEYDSNQGLHQGQNYQQKHNESHGQIPRRQNYYPNLVFGENENQTYFQNHNQSQSHEQADNYRQNQNQTLDQNHDLNQMLLQLQQPPYNQSQGQYQRQGRNHRPNRGEGRGQSRGHGQGQGQGQGQGKNRCPVHPNGRGSGIFHHQQKNNRFDSNWAPRFNDKYSSQRQDRNHSPTNYYYEHDTSPAFFSDTDDSKSSPRSPHSPPHSHSQNPNPSRSKQFKIKTDSQSKNAEFLKSLGYTTQVYSEVSGNPLSWTNELSLERPPINCDQNEGAILPLDSDILAVKGHQGYMYDANVDRALEAFCNATQKLALDSTDFITISRETLEKLKKNLKDENTLAVIITLLVDQSITNSSFCNSGAKLAYDFSKGAVTVGEDTFEDLFFRKCKEEFTNSLDSMAIDPVMNKRTLGLIHFFAELYLSFVDVSRQSVKNRLFGSAALELMSQFMLIQPVTADSFIIIFRALQRIGWDLEGEEDDKIKRDIEKLFTRLDALRSASTSTAEVELPVKSLVETLFEIRSKNWQRTSDRKNSLDQNQMSDNLSGDQSQNQDKQGEIVPISKIRNG